MDNQDEKVIAAVDRMVRRDLEAVVAKTEMAALLESRELVVLRSCPAPVFAGFLDQLDRLYQTGKFQMQAEKRDPRPRLYIVGKEADIPLIEQHWSGSYELSAIEGTYTYDKIMRAEAFRTAPCPETVLFFSRVLSDENYINIYEIVERMDFKRPLCYDFNGKLTEITDMKKYMAALRLWLAAGAWYWERNRQG